MRKVSFLAFIAGGAFSVVANAALSGNLLTNPGAEVGMGADVGSTVASWTVGGTSNPGRDNGTFDNFPVHSGAFDFYGGSGGNGTLTQVVPLAGLGAAELAVIDAGTETLNVEFFEQSLDQGGPNDAGQVKVSFQDTSQAALAGGYDSGLIANVGGWKDVTGTVTLPAGTRFLTYQMVFTLRNGSDVDSFIDDAGVTVGTSTAPITPPTGVPLPSSFPAGLALLGCLGLVQLCRRGWGVAGTK